MGGGIKRNKSSLPKGRSGIYGGTAEPQPGDEVVGGWTRSEREEMSARFAEAMRVRCAPARPRAQPRSPPVSSRGGGSVTARVGDRASSFATREATQCTRPVASP